LSLEENAQLLTGPKQACSTADVDDSVTSQRNAIEAVTIATYRHKIGCFEAYVRLLYHDLRADHLHVDPSLPAFTGNETNEAKKDAFRKATRRAVEIEYRAILDLYVYCEHVQDLEAKKVLLSTFVESARRIRDDGASHLPCREDAQFIYSNTSPGDPIREFMVDCYAIEGTRYWLERESAMDYAPQFLFDVLAATFEYRSKPEPGLASRLEDATYYCNKLKMPEST
jgi:hypothetical protein